MDNKTYTKLIGKLQYCQPKQGFIRCAKKICGKRDIIYFTDEIREEVRDKIKTGVMVEFILIESSPRTNCVGNKIDHWAKIINIVDEIQYSSDKSIISSVKTQTDSISSGSSGSNSPRSMSSIGDSNTLRGIKKWTEFSSSSNSPNSPNNSLRNIEDENNSDNNSIPSINSPKDECNPSNTCVSMYNGYNGYDEYNGYNGYNGYNNYNNGYNNGYNMKLASSSSSLYNIDNYNEFDNSSIQSNDSSKSDESLNGISRDEKRMTRIERYRFIQSVLTRVHETLYSDKKYTTDEDLTTRNSEKCSCWEMIPLMA